MTEDILDMMAKAKKTGGKKKAATKKSAKSEVVKIPDKKKEVPIPLTEAEKDQKFVEETLKKYKLESNIPIRHPYWDTCNRIRGRRQKR